MNYILIINKWINRVSYLKEQQRLFNTFVRESISQLLGPDFMRDHDVQDIDAQVMDMIRSIFQVLEYFFLY